jgi:hypothetical protein
MSNPAFQTLLATLVLPESALAILKSNFKTVHYYPKAESIPKNILPEIECLFTQANTLPSPISSLPKLRHIQLGSAGSDGFLKTGYLDDTKLSDSLTLSTASGTHVLSIPNWVVGNIIGLYLQLPTQIMLAKVSTEMNSTDGKTKAKWTTGNDIEATGGKYYARKLNGRTAGLLVSFRWDKLMGRVTERSEGRQLGCSKHMG